MNILITLFTETVCTYAALLAIMGFTKDSLVLLISFAVFVPVALAVVNCSKPVRRKY